jgi:hypothetical protein
MARLRSTRSQSRFRKYGDGALRCAVVHGFFGPLADRVVVVLALQVQRKYGGLQKPGGIFYDIGSGTGKPVSTKTQRRNDRLFFFAVSFSASSLAPHLSCFLKHARSRHPRLCRRV